jgi:hypothetical protein
LVDLYRGQILSTSYDRSFCGCVGGRLSVVHKLSRVKRREGGMDDQQGETNLPAAAPGGRLERLGYESGRKKPSVLKELTPKMRLLIAYMVNGADGDFVRRLTRPVQQVDEKTGEIVTVQKPIEPGEPLTLIEAADLLRIRRRQARDLLKQGVFSRHLATEVQALRTGEKAASVHRMIAIRDDAGQGRAADKKVQLQAAQAILGEGEGNRPSVAITVNNSLQAGYVIRIPTRHEAGKPATIDARPNGHAAEG